MLKPGCGRGISYDLEDESKKDIVFGRIFLGSESKWKKRFKDAS